MSYAGHSYKLKPVYMYILYNIDMTFASAGEVHQALQRFDAARTRGRGQCPFRIPVQGGNEGTAVQHAAEP